MFAKVVPVYRKSEIVSCFEEPTGYINLDIHNPYIAERALPGQFVMVRGVDTLFTPLFSRPFDIVSVQPREGLVSFCVKVKGLGTQQLARVGTGGFLMVNGPLGNGIYKLPPCSQVVLLGRGVGAAALVALAGMASAQGIPVISILSARTSTQIVCREYFEKYSTRIVTVCDDEPSPYGQDGAAALESIMESLGQTSSVLFTCGSRRFGRKVKELDRLTSIDGYVFLESVMACGMGDCHGCVVPKDAPEGGYLTVCHDGPVFPAREVIL